MPDASNGFKLSLGRLNWHCHADFRAGRGAPALLPQLHFPPWRVRSPHPCTVHSKPTLNQSSIRRPPLCLAFSHRRDVICFPSALLQSDLAKFASSPKPIRADQIEPLRVFPIALDQQGQTEALLARSNKTRGSLWLSNNGASVVHSCCAVVPEQARGTP